LRLEVSIRKKWRETASLQVVHYAKFPYFFLFWVDTPSTKTNKFIPYHLIISKHRYYGIKPFISDDLFMHHILCDVCVLRHKSMDSKIHPIFQPIEKFVIWKIKWYLYALVHCTYIFCYIVDSIIFPTSIMNFKAGHLDDVKFFIANSHTC
jgi:hypothetical protein